MFKNSRLYGSRRIFNTYRQNCERKVGFVLSRWIAITFVSVLSAACGPSREWDEEVRLSSGEILRVHRTQKWEGNQPIGEAKGYINKKSTVYIESIKSDRPSLPWEGDYEMVMIVDKDPSNNNEYFIITTPGACWRWDELGRPDPPYIEYRFRGQKWQRTEWSKIAVGRKPNIWMMPNPTDMKTVIRETDIVLQAQLPIPYGVVIENGKKPGC